MKNSQLHGWCRSSGVQSLNGRKKFIAALPEVFRRHMYKDYDFGSIYEYAAKLCGVSHAMVDDVIRVDKKLEDMPKLKALMPKVGLSKLRRVANIATKETENEWVEKVQKMSKPGLETHLRDIKDSRPGPGIPKMPEDPVYGKEFKDCTFKLDSDVMLKLRIIKSKMKKGTTWNDVFERLVDVPTPRPQKNPKPSNPESRQPSTKQRREALAKTNGKCSIEGCEKPAKELHHKKPWAKFHNHDDLQPLCKDHHELAHQSDSGIDTKFRAYKRQSVMF